MSQASATNDAPAAIPPVQKYSGTSQVHTGACMIGPCTVSGSGPVRALRAASRITSRSGACEPYSVSSL